MIPSYPRLGWRWDLEKRKGGREERFIRRTHTQRGERVRGAYGREGVNEVGRNSSFFFPCWRREERKGKGRKHTLGPQWNRFAWINFHSIEWLLLYVLLSSFPFFRRVSFPRRCDLTWCRDRIWMDYWLGRVDLKIRMNYYRETFLTHVKNFWFTRRWD